MAVTELEGNILVIEFVFVIVFQSVRPCLLVPLINFSKILRVALVLVFIIQRMITVARCGCSGARGNGLVIDFVIVFR